MSITELWNAVSLLSGTYSDLYWATTILVGSLGGCLSPFPLLELNSSDWVVDTQQGFISHSSGGWVCVCGGAGGRGEAESKLKACRLSV